MTCLCHSQVLVAVPLRALLDQFASDFRGFCKVGMGHNKKIDFNAKGFIAVTDSVHLLKKLKFDSTFVDEAHHPLPPQMPQSAELYRFSATHKDEPDFRYTMGQAIEDGVLCDYDITVPALTAHHAYVCLADLLLKQAGRFRRVLAYCNSVAEAKRFRMVLRELGLAAWHINGKTPLKKRQAAIAEFAGPLQKPVHVLVTVEVLGEGINIPNADTCMFVEPRNSYRSIIQAIGRVLRYHPAKTLAHIVLPAVAIPSSRSASVSPSSFGSTPIEGDQQLNVREVDSLYCQGSELPSWQVEQQVRNPHRFGAAEDEVTSGPNSPAAISVATPPGVIRSDSSEVHPAIHSHGQQSHNVRSNHSGDFDAIRLKRKPSSSNYDEPRTQVSPSATTDCQQEHLQTIGGPIESLHRNELTQAPQEETQNKDLERFKPGTHAPTTPGRPGVLEGFGGGIDDQEPTMHENQAMVWAMGRQTFKLKAPGGAPVFNQQFGSELERFLATLMLADHRLVGAAACHRIQIADCTLADASKSMVEGVTTEIYGRLCLMLSQEDHWETCLRSLEAFVDKHGRLPLRSSNQEDERRLGTWMNNQGRRFKKQGLSVNRFQQLLASSPIIRRRVEGWQAGDPDGRFSRKYNELREYVQLHHRLPDMASHQRRSSSWKLAKWVANLQGGNIRLDTGKMQMLQELHPLVKAEIQKWQSAPRLQQSKWEWKFGQVSEFVLATGRLPTSRREQKVERSCYTWLGVQCRRLQAGYLPDDLAQRLRNAHPLIAAYIDASA